jgi:hypothetical protein
VAPAELIRSPSTGLTKRVFKGQRWIVISQRDETDKTWLFAFGDEATAKRINDACYRNGDEVHYIEQAEVVS